MLPTVITVKETINRFKVEFVNQKQLQNFEVLSFIIQKVDTFFVIATKSTSVGLTFFDFGLIGKNVSTEVACIISLFIESTHEKNSNKIIKQNSIIRAEQIIVFFEVFCGKNLQANAIFETKYGSLVIFSTIT